jgi:glycosyltransferase involved in cell wall biosynthesis
LPPLISVILCVRDGATYLREALDSVAAQDVKGLEAIVVDDGSTDDSHAIALRHPVAAHVVRQNPLGLPAALNRGLSEARGKFVCFIDADDVWPSNRLKDLIAALDRSASLDGVFGAFVNTNAHLEAITPPLSARGLHVALLRRDSALRIGNFRTDVAHAANVDWISRAYSIGLTFCTINSIVSFRRIHGDNMGMRDRARGMQDMLRVVRDHHARNRRG